MLSDIELKKLIRFLKILKTIEGRTNSNCSSSQIREVEHQPKNEPSKLHRGKRNNRIS
jgi:hypothetical protein